MGLFDFIRDKNKSLNAGKEASSDNLGKLMEKAISEAGSRPLFYATLLESELIVLTNEPSENEGMRTLQKDSALNIVSFEDGKIPVFTSTDRIFDQGVIKSQIKFIGINGRDLFETTRGASIILNPFSSFNKELSSSEVSSLLDGSMFKAKEDESLKANTRIRIGQPAKLPDGLEKTLCVYSENREEIQEVYIAMIERVDSGEEPTLLIGLKVSDREQEVFSELGAVIQPFVPEGKRINFMKIEGTEGLSGYFESIKPVYKKITS